MIISFVRHRLPLGLIAGVSLLIQGCAVQPPIEAGLTPQQLVLRGGVGQQNNPDYAPKARGVETAVIGAVALGILGAALGAATGHMDNALIGGAAGALIGGAGGAAVANQAQKNIDEEAAKRQAIAAANNDAQRFATYASAANQVAAAAKEQVNALNARYHAGQLTAAEFRGQTASYQRDLIAVQTLSADSGRVRNAMLTAGQDNPDLGSPADAVDNTTRQLNRAQADLARTLAMVPGA